MDSATKEKCHSEGVLLKACSSSSFSYICGHCTSESFTAQLFTGAKQRRPASASSYLNQPSVAAWAHRLLVDYPHTARCSCRNAGRLSLAPPAVRFTTQNKAPYGERGRR